MRCNFCGGNCVKNGCQYNGKQRFKCRHCNKKQQQDYDYKAYKPQVNQYIVDHIKEGVGVSSLARLLHISTTTLMKRILEIANKIIAPHIVADSIYEVDEIKTYIGRKQEHIWIAYALNRKDKSIACFAVGPRTNATLYKVLGKLNNAKCIYTDRLRQYKSLIDQSSHKTILYGTNHIEHNNLTIRTHIKRLTRRTICFSRKAAMLYAIMKIYFWG